MLKSRPRLVEGAAHLHQDGLHLLIHPRRPRWAALNGTGYRVARLCDGRRSTGEIAAQVAARYDRSPSSVQDDVRRCLERLEQAGLLTEEKDEDSLPAYPRPTLRGLRLHLDLSGSCNLRCLHCGVPPVPTGDELPTEVVLRLIDDLAEGGAEGIAVSGGEPLLRDDCLDVLRYAAGRLPRVILSTNGTLIDEAVAAELARLDVSVQVSLDGATPGVHDRVRGAGAFARAWRGIERLQQAGIGERLALSCTLMRPNLDAAPRVVALARRRGVAAVRFFALQRVGRAAEAWEDLAPTPEAYDRTYTYLYRDYPREDGAVAVDGGLNGFVPDAPDGERWCRLGRSLAVDASGDIYPCSLLMARRFRLGNVRKVDLREALGQNRLRKLLRRCAERVDAIVACRACEWRAFCQAGCPATVWWLQGTFEATDGLCDIRRRLYRRAVCRRHLQMTMENGRR